MRTKNDTITKEWTAGDIKGSALAGSGCSVWTKNVTPISAKGIVVMAIIKA